MSTKATIRSEPISEPDVSLAKDLLCNHRFPTLDKEEIQSLLDDYRIMEIIGVGGMGAGVFMAHQKSLDRTVAIKVLPWCNTLSYQSIKRFSFEARAVAKTTHPNIVTVHDYFEVEGASCLVLEYVPGETLAERLKRGMLTSEVAISYLSQICKGLAVAHSQGILHRDLKPSNIMITRSEEVKIVDFGIAKILQNNHNKTSLLTTGVGVLLGTPHYMAPEQTQGGSVDVRSDIFSLGVIAYEMLTGVLPQGRFQRPSRRSHVPSWLDDCVLKMLNQEADHRYPNVSSLLNELNNRQRFAVPSFNAEPQQKVISNTRIFWTRVSIITFFLSFLIVISHNIGDNSPERVVANSLGMKFVSLPGESTAISIWETRVRDFSHFVSKSPLEAPGQMRSFTVDSRDGTWPHSGYTWKRPEFGQEQDHPVIGVSFRDAIAFCRWLTAEERDNGNIDSDWEYRLPTVEEWKKAAGYKGRYPWGETWHGIFNQPPSHNFRGEEFRTDPAWRGPATRIVIGYNDRWLRTCPVETFPPNALGIYGMADNASEWCYPDIGRDSETAPTMGGSWATAFPNDVDLKSISAVLSSFDRTSCVGFRIVLAPLEKPIVNSDISGRKTISANSQSNG